MDKNIPTAEEFLDPSDELMDNHDVEEALIAFAKLHVEAALKAAADKAQIHGVWETIVKPAPKGTLGNYKRFIKEEIDKQSILNAYPLTNIK